MEIYLIRHGMTRGNLEHRYVGRTDEGLLEESRAELEKSTGNMKKVDAVYCSRLKRCIQTAKILFPEHPCEIRDGLEEMDFGDFEYRNYMELQDNRAYQRWLDSGGSLPFPSGEGQEHFKKRCRRAFSECLLDAGKKGCRRIAFCVHGGTIMAVMEKYAVEKRGYYDWQVGNGCGYLVEWNEDQQEIRLNILEVLGKKKEKI